MELRILRKGSTGSDVTQLQSILIILTYKPGPIDGIFGVKTASAVIQLQKDNELVQDGIVGPITWRYIQAMIASNEIYIVQSGDTLYKIALAKNMSVSDILDFNPGINPNLLMIGQAIQLPPGRITDPSLRITYPKDGAILPYRDLDVTWTAVPGATGYTLQITDIENPQYPRDYITSVSADTLSFKLTTDHIISGYRYTITVYIVDPSAGYGVSKYMPKVTVTIGESKMQPPVIRSPQDNMTVSKTDFVLQYSQPDIEGNIDRTLILTSTSSPFSKDFKVNTDHPEIPEKLPSFWFDNVPTGTYDAAIIYENTTQGVMLSSKPIRITLTE